MAKESKKISFEGKRGAKITYLIEEGKTVEEGEVLCRLDTTEVEKQIEQHELDIVKTDADLDTARTELEIQKSENIAGIEKSHIELAKARKELEKYRDGDAPKDRRNLEVAIKEAKNTFSRAKKKYEDSVKLLEQEYINKSQVEQDQIQFERADIQLDGAERDLEIFDKYTNPMAMTDKETAVSDAQRTLDNGQKRAGSKLRQKEVAVESEDGRLTRLKKTLEELKDDQEKCTIKSPTPGIVIYGEPNRPWYRDQIKLGGQIWGGFTLFTIPDLRVMQVRVKVHEADINKVEMGLKATVSMDTYPGKVFAGEITKIATIAGGGNSWRGESEVKEFAVEITLESISDLELKPGISAKAEILVDRLEDVIHVPIQCVFLEEGKHFCHIVNGQGAPERVEVTPGVTNDSYIQIVEGVAEGDRVLLYNPMLPGGTQRLGDDPPVAEPPAVEKKAIAMGAP